MLYYISGTDTFRSRQKLNAIISAYTDKNPGAINLQKFFGDVSDWADVKNALDSQTIFSGKKLIIVESPWQNIVLADSLAKYILDQKIEINQDVILVIWSQEVFEKSTYKKEKSGKTKSNKLSEVLIKKAVVDDYESLVGVRLEQWVLKEFAKDDYVISTDLARRLAFLSGPDLWLLNGEINKLKNYRLEEKKIEPDDLDLFVKTVYSTDIFKTIDALGKKDRKTALRLLNQHLIEGESAIYLLTMFVYQFRILLRIKDLIVRGTPTSLIASKTNLHPFVIQKSTIAARYYSLDELKAIYHQLAQIDIKTKTGLMEPVEALNLFVVEATA